MGLLQDVHGKLQIICAHAELAMESLSVQYYTYSKQCHPKVFLLFSPFSHSPTHSRLPSIHLLLHWLKNTGKNIIQKGQNFCKEGK